MEGTKISSGHPRGLYLLFFTEMWERFSYYGMRAIFSLYMIKALLFDKSLTSNIYGSYTGLVYLTPLLGGYISDRYFGNRKSIITGGILMAIGQFLLFTSGMFYDNPQLAQPFFFIGLTFLIIGNGFFKPNISTMVGQLYPQGDKRIDAAFTIFYMGINLGAFLSPLVCGGLGDTGNPADFKWGFLAAGTGMVISTISFHLLKDKYLVAPNGTPLGMPKNKHEAKAEELPAFKSSSVFFWIGTFIVLACILSLFKLPQALGSSDFSWSLKNWFAGEYGLDIIGGLIFSAAVAIPGLIITDSSLTGIERQRIWVIFILSFFVIFFWSAFEQAGVSLTFFAEEQTNRDVPINIPNAAITIIYAALIYFIVHCLTWFFEWTKKTKYTVSGILISIVMILFAMGYIKDFYQEIIPASWFQSVNAGAIIIFATPFSLLWLYLGKNNREPSSPLKMSLGLLLLSLGYVVISYKIKGVSAVDKVSMIWLISLYLLHTYGELCLSPIGLSMVSKLAPIRFSSLLMGTWFLANAAANKLAGTLSALYPPGEAEFQKASKLGIDLPAILNKTIVATQEQLQLLKINEISSHYPVLLGNQITNLYEFFMIFLIMSAVASLVLFFLFKKLQKMMHGVH